MEQHSIYEILWYISITVIDIRRWQILQLWTTLLGNFRESSRKVLKFDIWLFIYLFHVSIVWDKPRSVAFNLYCHNSMPTFTFRPSKIFIVNNNAYFVFHLYGTPFCIDAALMEISMAIILYQYRHYEKFLLISEMQYGNGFVWLHTFVSAQCSMEMVFDWWHDFVWIQALLQNVLFDGTILYQLKHYGKVDWWHTFVSMQALLQNALFDGTLLYQRRHYWKVDWWHTFVSTQCSMENFISGALLYQ